MKLRHVVFGLILAVVLIGGSYACLVHQALYECAPKMDALANVLAKSVIMISNSLPSAETTNQAVTSTRGTNAPSLMAPSDNTVNGSK